MNAAVIVMWNGAKLGREAASLALVPEVAEYWGKQAAAGKCTEPRTYWSRRGPQVWLVEGDYDTLLELTNHEQAQKIEMKARLLLEDFSLEVRPLLDENVVRQMQTVLSELGYA